MKTNSYKEKVIVYAPNLGFTGLILLSASLLLVGLTYEKGHYHYSIFNHFISELGHSISSPFYLVFSAGLCVAGPMLTILIMGIGYHLDSKIGYWAMRVGIVSGIACFFVGIFPADLMLMAHLIAALIFFFCTLITSSLFSVAIYLDRGNKIPLWYIIPSLLVVVIGAIFLSLPTEEVAEFLKDREAYVRPDLWLNPFFEWLVLISLGFWMLLMSLFLKGAKK